MSKQATRSRRIAVTAIAASAALGASVSAAGAPASATTAPAGEPSGTVTIAYPAGSRSLDPHQQAFVVDPIYTFLIYDRLTQIDTTTFETEPMLATSWEFVDDGAALEMTLRDDVTFNDGTPFDAEAVKVNIDRQLTDEAATTQGLLASIAGVEVVDQYLVRFDLVPGQGAELPANLGTHAGAMISPAALDSGRDLAVDPGDAGSGAYLLTSYDPELSYTFDNAPGDYWDPEAGLMEQIEIQIVTSTPARLSAARTGEVDLAHLQLPEAVESIELAEAGEFNVFVVSNFLGVHSLHLDGADERLADPRVRRAIALAIDREGIGIGVFSDGCTATEQPYPDTHWAANPDMTGTTFPYDPDGARALLEEAGVDDLELSIIAAGGTPFELVATAVQAQLADIGITATLDPRATSADSATAFLGGDGPAFQSSLTASPNPAVVLEDYFLGGYEMIKDEAQRAEIETMAASALDPALDPDARSAIYRDIWASLAEGVWTVPICRTFQTYAYADGLGGVEQMGLVNSGYFDARSLYWED